MNIHELISKTAMEATKDYLVAFSVLKPHQIAAKCLIFGIHSAKEKLGVSQKLSLDFSPPLHNILDGPQLPNNRTISVHFNL